MGKYAVTFGILTIVLFSIWCILFAAIQAAPELAMGISIFLTITGFGWGICLILCIVFFVIKK